MEDCRNVGVAFRDFTFELAAITEGAHDDEALQGRLLRLGERHVGALGMALAGMDEDEPGAGRIVAATGMAAWALGRPIRPEIFASTVLDKPAPYRLPLDVLEPLTQRQLRALGTGWIWVHPIRVRGRLSAVLGAFMEENAAADADETAVFKLVAAGLGYAYRSRPETVVRATADERELFMAVTSHELRTPVTVIKGYAGDPARPLGQADRLPTARVGDGDRSARQGVGPHGRSPPQREHGHGDRFPRTDSL
jgi:signal transduction histidine kinase